MTEDKNSLVIPDIGGQAPPPYSVAERPSFVPGQDAPATVPRITGWIRGAAPELIFGIPEGWAEVSADRARYFPVELAHIGPDAPILASTRIVAAAERGGAQAHPWSVQLRHYAASVATVVLQDPLNWAKAKSAWAEFIAPPVYRTVAGDQAVVLRYLYESDGALLVRYEAWAAHAGGGYHFVASGPAADELEVWSDWEAMLQSSRSESAPVPPAPSVHYRCGVRTDIPVTLENVANEQRSLVIFGSGSGAAWAAFAAVGMRLYADAKALGLEGKTISVPAQGEATLMDDRLVIRATADVQARGVRLRGDAASRSADLEIPYRIVKAFGTDPIHGVWLDVVGRGAVWIQPQDKGEFAQWLAHLSYNRTWQPPQRLTTTPGAIAGWCQQDSRYTFGLPTGWAQPPARALADYARLFQPSIIRCAVVLDAGKWEAQLFVIEDGAWAGPVDDDSLVASILAATNITPVGAAQVTNIDGEPAALVRGRSWTADGQEERCYGTLVHAGVRYALWYGTVGGATGDSSYERYLADFHTMLATWHWYR